MPTKSIWQIFIRCWQVVAPQWLMLSHWLFSRKISVWLSGYTSSKILIINKSVIVMAVHCLRWAERPGFESYITSGFLLWNKNEICENAGFYVSFKVKTFKVSKNFAFYRAFHFFYYLEVWFVCLTLSRYSSLLYFLFPWTSLHIHIFSSDVRETRLFFALHVTLHTFNIFFVKGIRDYIHIMDLAAGHVAALNALCKQHLRLKFYNLGTGKGVSVLDLVKTFEKVTGTTIPYVIRDRREGDIVSMYADTELAEKELGWKSKYDVEQMCEYFTFFVFNWHVLRESKN